MQKSNLMRKIWIGGLLLLMAAGWSSCKNMLDIESTRAVTEENMWASKNDAWAGSFACYGLLRAAMCNENSYWAHGELRAGHFTITKRGDLQAVRKSLLTSNYVTMDTWRDWRKFYAIIAQCNIAIAKLPGIPALDERYSSTEMELDLAQVRFIRAFTYFYMARIWGDVPLITEPVQGDFATVPRTEQNEVLNFAYNEANTAINKLPWQFDGVSPEQPGNYRGQGVSHWRSILTTKGAGLTLMAHIRAWQKDYQGAMDALTILRNNQSKTGYARVSITDLVSNGGTFRGRRNENILQMDMNFDHAEISTTGQIENWTLRAPDVTKKEAEIYVTKDSILNIFPQASDLRILNFFTDMGSMQPMFYKMKMLNDAVKNPTLRFFNSAIVIFRYEELLLLEAECQVRLDNPGPALTILNDLRGGRNITPLVNTLTKEQMLEEIFQERRRELMGEGWLWYDLVTFGKVTEYTGLSEADIQNGAIYWPISRAALSLNPKLTQFNYWK